MPDNAEGRIIDLSNRQGLSGIDLLRDDNLFIASVYQEFRNYLSDLINVVSEMSPSRNRGINRMRNRVRSPSSFLTFLGSPTNLFVSGKRGTGKTTLVSGLMSDREFLERSGIEIVGFVDLPSIDHSILPWFMSYLFNIVDSGAEDYLEIGNLSLLALLREVAAAVEVIVGSSGNSSVGYWESIQRRIFSIRVELCEIVDELLRLLNRRAFVIIVDDIDIANVEKIRKFLRETYYFLSCPRLIVLGLGDWDRLLYKLAYREIQEMEGGIANANYSGPSLEKIASRLAEAKIEKVFSYRWLYPMPQKPEPENLRVRYLNDERNIDEQNVLEYIRSRLRIGHIYAPSEVKQLVDGLSLRKLVQILERITYYRDVYTLADLYALVSSDVEIRSVILG